MTLQRERLSLCCVACRDDAVFHDDFLTLFPQYWAAVPPNYEYIAVGMIPRHFNVSKEAVYGGNSLPRHHALFSETHNDMLFMAVCMHSKRSAKRCNGSKMARKSIALQLCTTLCVGAIAMLCVLKSHFVFL